MWKYFFGILENSSLAHEVILCGFSFCMTRLHVKEASSWLTFHPAAHLFLSWAELSGETNAASGHSLNTGHPVMVGPPTECLGD